MRASTLIMFRAFFSVGELAELRGIQVVITPFVLNRVIIVTTFVVMWCCLPWTVEPLEILQVKVPYDQSFPSTRIRSVDYHKLTILFINCSSGESRNLDLKISFIYAWMTYGWRRWCYLVRRLAFLLRRETLLPSESLRLFFFATLTAAAILVSFEVLLSRRFVRRYRSLFLLVFGRNIFRRCLFLSCQFDVHSWWLNLTIVYNRRLNNLQASKIVS
jgi:hypothetical protein